MLTVESITISQMEAKKQPSREKIMLIFIPPTGRKAKMVSSVRQVKPFYKIDWMSTLSRKGNEIII